MSLVNLVFTSLGLVCRESFLFLWLMFIAFDQCSGCMVHHKIADNLGLVVEYNFQEETNVDPDTNQL